METIIAMLLLSQTIESSRLMTILPNVIGILKLLVTFHQRNVKYHNHMVCLSLYRQKGIWKTIYSFILFAFSNFIYISSDSYETARSQEHIASIKSEINSEGEDDASQPNTSLGRGKDTRDQLKDSCLQVMMKALVYMGQPSQKQLSFLQFQLVY
jgi:hypothetical protein